jgi:hypothetical protein
VISTPGTTDGCGVVSFIDYGAGESGGDNDDYLVIRDYCADGHGVIAYVWVENVYLGSKYNCNGLAGAAVIWDPCKARGDVAEGERASISVCLVDGASDPTPSKCGVAGHGSADG